MQNSFWSVSCTTTHFISNREKDKVCTYVCPVYSCQGSFETRAVSAGNITVTQSDKNFTYQGRLNYYQQCVRGSKHSSGRCYDCEVLYKVITQVYTSPLPSPTIPRKINFSRSFLSSSEN